MKDVVFNKLLNFDSDNILNILNLILDLVFNDFLLIEVLDESRLIVDFNNFALIINYNNTLYAKDYNDIFIKVLFKSRIIIEDNDLLIAKDDNKKLIENLDSSLNSS